MKNILKAFTLAELMIVMSVIGILAAVLIPIANNARPDEHVMKFKKANATLGNVIRELVTSDKYYADGDLGMKPNGDLIDGTHTGDKTYFCNTFADTLNTKSVNCRADSSLTSCAWLDTKTTHIDIKKGELDKCCKLQEYGEIETTDGIFYYLMHPAITFGVSLYEGKANSNVQDQMQEVQGWSENTIKWGKQVRLFGDYLNSDNLDVIYKIFCIDVDGIPSGGSENCDDKNDICPFGYGIRVDGKIFPGARADAWMEKSIQKGGNK